MLVAAESSCAFLAFDGYGNDFIVEASSLNCPPGPGLRHQGVLILLVARNLILLGQHLGSLAHYHLGHGTKKSVAIHAIDQFLMTQTISPARTVKIVGKTRHGLRAAGKNAVGIAQQNGLVG